MPAAPALMGIGNPRSRGLVEWFLELVSAGLLAGMLLGGLVGYFTGFITALLAYKSKEEETAI
jgi:hypothetical protein